MDFLEISNFLVAKSARKSLQPDSKPFPETLAFKTKMLLNFWIISAISLYYHVSQSVQMESFTPLIEFTHLFPVLKQ